MITVKEVAKHAKVSPATVSRVLNDAQNVSPEIRSRVQKTIKHLGYFPNNAARSLVRRQTGSIAVLLRDLHSPYYIELLHGIEEAAARSERNVIFCSLGREQDYRDRYIQFLTNGIADAIILYGPLFSDQPIIEHLSSVNFPFLLIENNFESLPVNQILVNNLEGARSAVEYLIDKGHKRIAYFMGDPNKNVNLLRFNGYTQTMQNHGLTIDQGFIKNIFTDYDSAYRVAREIMQQPPETRPTAIFCSNDRIAAKAIQGIQSLGRSVPEDMSVIGFDNQRIYEEAYKGPSITSVKQPLYEIGRDSIQHLSNILAGTEKLPFVKVYDTKLVVLDTVAGPAVE